MTARCQNNLNVASWNQGTCRRHKATPTVKSHRVCLPCVAIFANSFSGLNDGVFVIARALLVRNTFLVFIQVCSLSAAAAIHWCVSSLARVVSLAKWLASAIARSHVVAIYCAFRARCTVFAWRRWGGVLKWDNAYSTTIYQKKEAPYSPQIVDLQPLRWIPASEHANTYVLTAAHMHCSLFLQLQLSYTQSWQETCLIVSIGV